MISCLENASCTILVSFWPCELVWSFIEMPSLHSQHSFWPMEVQQLLKYLAGKLFLFIYFNALIHKKQRCFVTCTNSIPDHDQLWILAMFNNCQGTWSGPIILGVVSLLDGKELLISKNESLPVLTGGMSQKFSASLELHEFFFRFNVTFWNL